MVHFLHFLKIIKLRYFSESPHIQEIVLEIDVTHKVSPNNMSANADSLGFQLVCSVHVWAYFEK